VKWNLAFALTFGSFMVCFAQEPKVKRTTLKKSPENLAFAHLSDIHIGEGASNRDYGTKGFFDSLSGNESGYPAERLSKAVNWLNQHAQSNKIKFAIFSGDLTDSGEKSEFLHFKKIADSLTIPYIPLIGNHDIWSYNRFGEEDIHARGDSLMNEIFNPIFATLDSSFTIIADDRNKRWFDEESHLYCYLQNFVVATNQVHFVFLDFNPRYHVRKNEPGIGPEAQLHEGKGGTLSFLATALNNAKANAAKVVIISHHPPIASIVGFHYAFTAKEKTQLAKLLKPFKKNILGWLAGHIHRNAVYRFTKANLLKVVETKANKAQENGGFRIICLKK
jgi:3',5'-cyclic AMP phosphodiesterase CpdA